MSDDRLSLKRMLLEAGEICISKNAIVTLSRAFSIAKPIASLACKDKVADGDSWFTSLLQEGCEWPKVVFAKVDVFKYLNSNKISFDIRTLLGEEDPEDTYVHSFVQDIQQPFPVYPQLQEHLDLVYKYLAKHLIYRFVRDSQRQVVPLDLYTVYVRLDMLDLEEMKLLLPKAPDFTPIAFDDGVTTTCTMEGNGLSVRIMDNPSIAMLKEVSFDDNAFWLYIDHETAHVAGRAIQVSFE